MQYACNSCSSRVTVDCLQFSMNEQIIIAWSYLLGIVFNTLSGQGCASAFSEVRLMHHTISYKAGVLSRFSCISFQWLPLWV